MNLHVVPNSGLFNEENLDRQRAEALTSVAFDTPIPEAVVCYIRALEERLLDAKADQKKRFAREVGWSFKAP